MNKKVSCIGRKFEKKWNKKTKSQGTIGSGNLWFDKEDGKNPNWLFQNKATKKSYYGLQLVDIQKLKTNAEKTNRNWAFVICFNAESFDETVFVLIPLKLLTKMSKDFLKYKVGTCIMSKENAKQVKLKEDDLSNDWLNDKVSAVHFCSKNPEALIIMNEIDFLKAFKKTFI